MERLLKFRSRFRFVQFVDELWSRAAQFCDILYNGIPLLVRVATGCTMEQAEIAPAFTNGVEDGRFPAKWQ